jgi:hypothetical protein
MVRMVVFLVALAYVVGWLAQHGYWAQIMKAVG